MKTNDQYSHKFSSVAGAETDVFSALVKLSGLRPESDFQHSRLAGVDFSESDLSEFNLDYADLRGAKWEQRLSDPHSLRFSLRGSGEDEVSGSEFKDLRALVLSKKRLRWAERFFAFRLLVDNWGENEDTLEVLNQLLRQGDGTYLRLCCSVYFSASYQRDTKSKTLCINMANSGRSQVNIFRLKKLRHAASIGQRYFRSIDLRERYPGDLSQSSIRGLRTAMKLDTDNSSVQSLFDD